MCHALFPLTQFQLLVQDVGDWLAGGADTVPGFLSALANGLRGICSAGKNIAGKQNVIRN